MGRGQGLKSLDTGELHRELMRRRRAVPKLLRRRESLVAEVRSIDARLHALGVREGAGGLVARKRPRNEHGLIEALHELLSGKAMSVTAAAEAVQAAGYKTTSSHFRTIVNQTLINSGKFKRVGRGIYTAK